VGKDAMKHALIVIGLVCAALVGCAEKDALTAPRTLVAPYDTSRGEVLWAVAPLRNESGTADADPLAISDKIVAAVEEVQGVRAIPLNRVLQAMQALEMQTLRTPADARRLAQALGVDALLVGAITAYDPYTPTIGLSLALYPRTAEAASANSQLNPRALSARATEPGALPASRYEDAPVAVISEHLDGKNHQVLMDVRAYAEGRMDGPSAIGWRRYTSSMDLYTQFAAYHTVDRLMKDEWLRLPSKAQPVESSRNADAR
jgi:hypothetical protein